MFEVVEGRAPGHVGAAFDDQARRALGEGQRQKQGLEDEAGGAGAAALARLGHVEGVTARPRGRPGDEGEGLGAQFRPLQPGVADASRRQDPRQVLGRQPRLRALGADVLDAHWLSQEGGEGQRGAQHLPAPLAVGAVNDDHRCHIRFQRLMLCTMRASVGTSSGRVVATTEM